MRTVIPVPCVAEDLVVGDEAPVGGVAQVIGHGVKVGVGVHGEEGREKDGEVRGEVKGEVEQLRDNRTCAWREDGMTDSRDDLSQCGCDTCVMKTRHLTACRRAQTSRMLCLCLLVYVSLLSLSTLVIKMLLSSSSFA